MNEPEESKPGLLDRLNTALLRILPQHWLSAGMYRLARSEIPWLKNALIRHVIEHYDVDMREAEIEDPFAYPTFNAFFTRALKPTARPIDPDGLVSPVDAKVSQAGKIHHDRLLQAKGHEYSLYALLAGDGELASQFESGTFATLYLAPRDYHRIHMPLAGTLRTMVFVPGDLFSVSEATAQLVPGLFARNERVICLFDTERGPMAVVLVGAIFVGSMETVWHGEVRADGNAPRYWHYQGEDAPHFAKGEEIARFNMGSTVILLNVQHAVDLLDDLTGKQVRVGQKIGY
ncbi:MAG: phosphatidylserine decarboxylase [Gammaproteobacteria bacterium]|nr:MAG: phosphatidylserine decarboxylase [Gammaproteobacteria bacterium]